jgi:hypothetical protein
MPLALAGCVFNSQDLYRPLIPEAVPHKDAAFDRYIEAYPGDTDLESDPHEWSKKLEYSLKRTHKAWDYFDIQKWDSIFASLDTDRLLDALDSHEDNPFAWHMLAAYFAIQHQMDAAIDASEEGLRRIRNLWQRSPSQAAAARRPRGAHANQPRHIPRRGQ